MSPTSHKIPQNPHKRLSGGNSSQILLPPSIKLTDNTSSSLNLQGCIPSIFTYLWNSVQSYNTFLNIYIPNTIIFQNSILVDWFFTNKEGKISKKFKNLKIIKEIKKQLLSNSGQQIILAVWMTMKQNINDPKKRQYLEISYLKKEEIIDFFRNLPDSNSSGILQEFIAPLEQYNSVYKVSLSDHIFTVKRISNLKKFSDRLCNDHQRVSSLEQDSKSTQVHPIHSQALVFHFERITSLIKGAIESNFNGSLDLKYIDLVYKKGHNGQL